MQTKLRHLHGLARQASENIEETRTVEFVLSDQDKDRHRTVLNQDNWQLDNYNSNGVVGYQHNVYSNLFGRDDPDNVIGIGRAWVESSRLIGSVKFEPKDINPLAEKIFRKVIHGTLRAASVGFLPVGTGSYGKGDEAHGKPDETYYYEGQELIEFSIVNIPSNPRALKRYNVDELSPYIRELIDQLGLRWEKARDMKVYQLLELVNGEEVVDNTPLLDERIARLKDLEKLHV